MSARRTLLEQLSNQGSSDVKQYLFNGWVEDDVGNYYEGAMCVYETHDGNVVKAFNYDKNDKISRKNANEVIFLRRAHKLNSKCNLRTPIVYMSQELTVSKPHMKKYKLRDTLFYINMAKMHIPEKSNPLIQELMNGKLFCNRVKRNLTKVNKCLGNHSVYHNDYNDSNLRISPTGQIGMIDFGEASNKSGKNIMPLNFDCSNTRKTSKKITRKNK